ncbi:MAG: tetratricopeptide repeat protein [Longimicrobiales bacterium]
MGAALGQRSWYGSAIAALPLLALTACGGGPAPAPLSPVLHSPITGAAFLPLPDTAGAITAADAALASSPDSVELVLAAGHARSASWRYGAAIELYSRAVELAPGDWRPYRFRGHRYISTRQLPRAVSDLERAAALDTLGFDVAYHLGLAHYLSGEFERAAAVYGRCMRLAESPEALALQQSGSLPADHRTCMAMAADDEDLVAIADWHYRALRRAGRHTDALRLLDRIHEGMRVEENQAYYDALLFYKGLRTADQIWAADASGANTYETVGYAVGNWHLVEGDTARARAIFEQIVEQGDSWNAFGYIAAEQDVLRLRRAAR